VLLSLIAISVVLAGWALAARRLESWRITAPLFLVIAGAIVEYTTHDSLADVLNASVAEHAAEVILAVLLFVDAADVRGGLFGDHPRSAMRLLFIALPLSVGLAWLLGLWILPGVAWTTALIMACVVVPIDFASAPSVLGDQRTPGRVRDLLHVEAGYNDGIISPFLLFALVLAGDTHHATSPAEALISALPHLLVSLVVGLCAGSAIALAANFAERRGMMTDQSKRLALVAAPAVAFTVTQGLQGNPIVAAFVCGIGYHYFRKVTDGRRELDLIEDISFLLTAAMWFVFGGVLLIAYWRAGLTWNVVIYCALALTVVRMLPVAVAMLWSKFSWRERVLLGWLGPRGIPSIVFGLLAYNVLGSGTEYSVLLVMVCIVVGSVLLHGLGAPATSHRLAALRTE